MKTIAPAKKHLAAVLLKYNARACTLHEQLDLSNSAARALYTEHFRIPSPPGQTPRSTAWFVTRGRQAQSSLFANIFVSTVAADSGQQFALAYDAYRTFFDTSQQTELDPERAIFLAAMLSNKTAGASDQLRLHNCRTCATPTLDFAYKAKVTCQQCSKQHSKN